MGGLPFTGLLLRGDSDALGTGLKEHPDSKWLRTRFRCSLHPNLKARIRDDRVALPACLWGTHMPENWSRKFAMPLGVADRAEISLRPEIVALSSTDPVKIC